ncbi:CPBP family intramembrane metalloprotease [Romeria aff. gracilis LEGE 07310]|uniref:CPBP family intramembrane metalloprotease n=2 Tax=Vasconcelosia TaxID=3366328 RepID=A0A8J7AG23_9CYAN|nr:CPBP family intramembrane metalloprotease [Romeria aff. gracilis LEGE 07310]
MAVTAIVLLVIARLWLLFDSTVQLPLVVQPIAIALGLAVGAGISLASAAVYQIWPAYRRSADFYLRFVLAPLLPADALWMGLLPGLSEELLFRGVMLPAIGLNATGVIVSSLCFGVLHMTGWRQWPYVVWASGIGLILALSALMTGNLLVPVIAHITTNSASSLIWKLQTARE